MSNRTRSSSPTKTRPSPRRSGDQQGPVVARSATHVHQRTGRSTIMVVVLDADWRRQALRGAVALLFGAVTLVWPGITLTALVLLFGFFVLLDGVAMLIATFDVELPTFGARALLFLRALLSIGAGVFFFADTATT